jgi:hypothetical protein
MMEAVRVGTGVAARCSGRASNVKNRLRVRKPPCAHRDGTVRHLLGVCHLVLASRTWGR